MQDWWSICNISRSTYLCCGRPSFCACCMQWTAVCFSSSTSGCRLPGRRSKMDLGFPGFDCRLGTLCFQSLSTFSCRFQCRTFEPLRFTSVTSNQEIAGFVRAENKQGWNILAWARWVKFAKPAALWLIWHYHQFHRDPQQKPKNEFWNCGNAGSSSQANLYKAMARSAFKGMSLLGFKRWNRLRAIGY